MTRQFYCILVLFVGLIVVVSSCQKQESNIANGEDEENSFIINARASASDSRASVDDLAFTWVEEDALGVYVRNIAAGASEPFVIHGGMTTNKGTFRGNLPVSWSDNFYAIYPYDDTKTFTNNVNVKYTFALPAVQTQKFSSATTVDPTSIGEYIFMYGKSMYNIVSGPVTEVSSISMGHVMTIFDFVISDVPTTKKIHSLTLRAGENMFATSLEVDLDASVVALETPVTGRNIKVNLTNFDGTKSGIVGTGEDITIRLAMFPQTIAEGKEWILDIATSASDGAIATTVFRETITFGAGGRTYIAGNRYKSTLDFSKFSDVTYTLITAQYDRDKGAQGVGERANSYIIPASRTNEEHKLSIERVDDYWGSSNALYGGNNPENTITSNTDLKIKAVWADFDYKNRVFLSVNHSDKSMSVKFSDLPANGGNMIVAITKADEVTVLWSWHIWFSDIDTSIATELPSGQSIMDRNLGARSDVGVAGTTDTYGLKYQWGRKDPFPSGANAAQDLVEPIIYTPDGRGVLWSSGYGSSAEVGSIALGISNPFIYYVNGSATYDWVEAGVDAGVNSSRRWNNSLDGLGQGSKTIFDPCPNGWRVPWGSNWSGFFGEVNSDFIWKTYPVAGRWCENNISTFFPATGYRSSGAIKLNSVAAAGFYWSGTSQGAYADRLFFLGYVSPLYNGHRASGYAVRPVKDI